MLVSDQDLKYGSGCCLSVPKSGKNILKMFTDTRF